MRWFPILNDLFLGNQKWFDAETGFRSISTMNAMFEFILDSKAPGQTNQYTKGHNHDDAGGRVFGRNTAAVGDGGKDDFLAVTPALANTWATALTAVGGLYDRSTATPSVIPIFRPYITRGLNSPAGAPPTTPYLTALVWAEWTPASGTPTVTLRMKNGTLTRYSAETAKVSVATAANNKFLLVVDQIPCQSGKNDLDLQVKTSVTGLQVKITRVLFAEVCNAGAVTGSNGNIPLG